MPDSAYANSPYTKPARYLTFTQQVSNMAMPPQHRTSYHSGKATLPPINVAGAYMFPVVPYNGSFIVKHPKNIAYFDKTGAIVPSLSAVSADITLFGMFDLSDIEQIAYVYLTISTSNIASVRVVKAKLDGSGGSNSVLFTKQLPAYGYTEANSFFLINGIEWVSAEKIQIVLIVNRQKGAVNEKRELRFSSVGEIQDSPIMDAYGTTLESDVLLTYRSAIDGGIGVYTSSIRRASEVDSNGALCVIHGGMYQDVIYPNTIGVPVPTPQPSLNPVQHIIPVTKDTVAISTSVCKDGSAGASSPHQRVFDRVHFDAWLQTCAINGGSMFVNTLYGQMNPALN